MTLIVQKYGGTSRRHGRAHPGASADRWSATGARPQVVVVVSAMSGETNRLVGPGGESVSERPLPREMDVLLATGEQVTIALLAMALHRPRASGASRTLAPGGASVPTRSSRQGAHPATSRPSGCAADIDDGSVPVVAGFQGVDDDGNITTLGRGGSDTTAVALAAALQGRRMPDLHRRGRRLHHRSARRRGRRRLDQITFEEMLELASLGSKVLQIRAGGVRRQVQRAAAGAVDVRAGPRHPDHHGEQTTMEQPLVSGIAYSRDEAKMTCRGVPDVPGVASRILGPDRPTPTSRST